MNVKTGKREAVRPTALIMRRAVWLTMFYVALIFMLPANEDTMRAFHLSPMGYRTALLTLTLPLMAAWLMAFAAYGRLCEYLSLIRRSPEETHFEKLATGMKWLAWSLPVPAVAALLLSALANEWNVFYPASIIITNYLNLALALIAFSIIGVASRGLVNRANLKFNTMVSRMIVLSFLLGGVVYCYLTFQRLDLSSIGSTHNPYFLPVWLMVLSVIIPYLYAWFVGLLAAYELTLFSHQTEGVLYRQALRMLAVGLAVVIASLVILQYINGVQPRVGHLIFGYHTLLGAVLHAISGVGFILMLTGASRLKKIEEI